MRFIISALCLLSAPAIAHAQSASGEIGVHSNYLDDDGLVYTAGPVVQAGLYLDIDENCSLDVWGSHGFSTSAGGELDLGGSCRFSSGEAEFEVSANRYILRGSSDITAISFAATQGPIDIIVAHYLWDNNPDATRITAGYSIEASDKFTFRPALIYQTGFGERDVLGGGASVSYAITEQLSLIGTLFTPFKGGRTTQASVGLNFSF